MNKTVNDMVREVVEGEGENANKVIAPKDQGFSDGVRYALKHLAKLYDGIEETDIYHHFNKREGEGEREYTCSSCGWEIINSKWWLIAQTHSGKYLCDDCEMSLIVSEGEGV